MVGGLRGLRQWEPWGPVSGRGGPFGSPGEAFWLPGAREEGGRTGETGQVAPAGTRPLVSPADCAQVPWGCSGFRGLWGDSWSRDAGRPWGLPACPGPWKHRSSSVRPAQVTLECPGHEEVPRVDKLVEKILHCSCQACGKEPSHEGLSVYVQAEDAQGAQPGVHAHPQPGGQAPEPEEEGAED